MIITVNLSFFKKNNLQLLYDRQERIDGIDQEKIRRSNIGIIGAGATGSHTAIYSAQVGIGCVRICDYDKVEIHNISRMLGVSVNDVGRKKTDVIAKAINKIGNGTKTETYNLEAKHLPEKFFKNLNIAVICVDRISTRFEIAEILWTRNIPFIDIGIRELLLNVMVFLPGIKEWPCMFCMRQIIPEEQVEFSNRLKKCDEAPIPTILPPASIASSIALNEALKVLTDFKLGKSIDNFLQMDLRSLFLLRIKVPKDKTCPVCGTSNGV